MLTRRQIDVLSILLTSKDQEIVCDGHHCMIDLENISRSTVYSLLGHMAIKDAGYAGAGCDIYIPTQHAKQIIRRPALADEMVMCVVRQRPFTITTGGFIRHLRNPK